MPADPTAAQSDASRHNGARSTGPATEAGKARSARNATRHGLTGRTFFLMADEDETDWREHEALWLATYAPRDALEREAALGLIRAMWREMRADRLEVQVLTDLFAAGKLADPDEAAAAKAVAFKALGTLLRYRGRIEREHRQAMQALDGLRQRQLRRSPAMVPREPEQAVRSTQTAEPTAARAPVPKEPEPPVSLNRHQRRALQAIERQQRRLAA
jgi:hypothetical protein